MKPKKEPPDPTNVRAGDPPYTASCASEVDKPSKLSYIAGPPNRKHGDASWLGRLLVSVLVWGLYFAACLVPAIYVDDGLPQREVAMIRMGSPRGLVALLLGWIPPYCIPWSANILLCVGWAFLLVKRFKIAACVGGVSALIGLTTWGCGFPRLLAGYSLWQASLVTLAAGAAMLALLIPRQTKEENNASMSKMRILAVYGVFLVYTVVLVLTMLATKEAEAEKGIRALGGKVTPERNSIIGVSLRGTKVTDAGLKELAGLTSLQSLDLGGTKVTGPGLKELAGLKNLKTLDLDGTNVTDEGLKELAGLKSLENLLLGDTKVTDAGLKELAGLKSLRDLSLRGTKVTDAGVAELQTALPKCRISR